MMAFDWDQDPTAPVSSQYQHTHPLKWFHKMGVLKIMMSCFREKRSWSASRLRQEKPMEMTTMSRAYSTALVEILHQHYA